MRCLTTLVIFFVCFCSALCSTRPRILHRFSSTKAFKRFCGQKEFHGVTFDGGVYKFFSHRRQPGRSKATKHLWEEYRIVYDRHSDSFNYETLVFDFQHAVPIAGLNIASLDLYVEVYQNMSSSSLDLFACSSPSGRNCHFTTKNCERPLEGEWRRLGLDNCRQLVQPTVRRGLWSLVSSSASSAPTRESGRESLIYSPDLISELTKRTSKAKSSELDAHLAALFDGERIVYVLSDRVDPIQINSLRLADLNGLISSKKNLWFKKPVPSADIHDVLGIIPWQIHKNQAVFVGVSNLGWDSSNVRVVPLIQSSQDASTSLTFAKQSFNAKAFFGCQTTSQPSMGDMEFIRRSLSMSSTDDDYNHHDESPPSTSPRPLPPTLRKPESSALKLTSLVEKPTQTSAVRIPTTIPTSTVPTVTISTLLSSKSPFAEESTSIFDSDFFHPFTLALFTTVIFVFGLVFYAIASQFCCSVKKHSRL